MHVAIIVDGNGRWATRRGLPRLAGHRAGVGTARRVVERAVDLGIARLTLYAFSSDNWRRPAMEVEGIFWLLRAFLRLESARLRERGVRLRMIGRRDRLPEAALRAVEAAEAMTAAGRQLDLRVAIDYSSRDAIARAAAAMAGGTQQAAFHDLMAQNCDVDLLIRTGGEKRLSDFCFGSQRMQSFCLPIVCGRSLTRQTWRLRSRSFIGGSGDLGEWRLVSCYLVPPRTPYEASWYSSLHSFLAWALYCWAGPQRTHRLSPCN